MFNSLDPIWLFLGGLVIRYGGDLLKTIIQFGLQRLACQITIAETNPIYSAICWELERTGKVYDFSELIYTSTPLVPPAIESPTLKTKLEPRAGWIGIGYHGAYIGIHRHDFKVTELQNTQLITLATLRWWQPQMLAWLTEIEANYNLEAPLTLFCHSPERVIPNPCCISFYQKSPRLSYRSLNKASKLFETRLVAIAFNFSLRRVTEEG